MKQLHLVALLLLAGAVGLGITGLAISRGESQLASSLPASLFYTWACIAFAGALMCFLIEANRDG